VSIKSEFEYATPEYKVMLERAKEAMTEGVQFYEANRKTQKEKCEKLATCIYSRLLPYCNEYNWHLVCGIVTKEGSK